MTHKIYLTFVVAGFLGCIGALAIARWRYVGRNGVPRTAVLSLHGACRLWLLFFVTSIAISSLIGLFTGSLHETTFGYFLRAASGHARADSWYPMTEAIEQLRQQPGSLLYRELFFERHVKFQYPLSALLLLDIPQRLSGCSWSSLYRAINWCCWLCLPLVGWAAYKLFRGTSPINAVAAKNLSAPSILLLAGANMALIAIFYPLLKSFLLGQIQTLITLLVSFALLAFQRKRADIAGVLIGICCAIKPQWAVIVLWALVRRQWRMAGAMIAALGAFVLLAIYSYGASNFLDYLPVMSFLGSHGESFHANQSVNGLINRLLMNGNNLEWLLDQFPPFNMTVYAATAVSSLLIVAISVFVKINKNPDCIDFSVVLLGLTMASPIAWDHHYGILFPIFAVAIPQAISEKTFGKFTPAYLLIAFSLASQRLEFFTRRFSAGDLNFLQSYLFFGAVLTLVLLLRMSSATRYSGSATMESMARQTDGRLAVQRI